MSAQNAKDAADDIVAKLRLPADAKGRKFQLVTFASEEDCRFFYPRRALDWQRQVNTYISRALRERYGIRVQRIALTPADYREWLAREDAPELRRHFADAQLILLG
jgi:hypothetical protein